MSEEAAGALLKGRDIVVGWVSSEWWVCGTEVWLKKCGRTGVHA